jgi:hypothetical protein
MSMQSARVLIEKTVDDLKFDSSYLRVRSRDVLNDRDAEMLRVASEKIARTSRALERLTRTPGGS